MHDFLTIRFDESSVGYILLRFWGPALLTIVLGGLFASIIFPRWQDRYIRRKSFEERRLSLREALLVSLDAYITEWRRLIQCAEYEEGLRSDCSGEGLSARERADLEARLDAAHGNTADRARSRSTARDELMRTIALYRGYCDPATGRHLSVFAEWDEAQSRKRLNELPPIAEWRDRESDIRERVIQ